MTNLRMVLSQNIRSRRKALGLSQEKLAEKAGTASNYIAMIENCKQFPSTEMLENIAGALEMDTLELFNGSNAEIIRSLCSEFASSVESFMVSKFNELEARLGQC